MGERDKAEAALRQGLAQNPDDPLLNKELATTLLEAPADGADLPVIPDAALPYLEKALAQAPDDPELHWYLGIRALADGNPDDTREHWQKVLTQLDPTTPEHALVQSRLDLLSVN
jgi:cytochrome c-type biogenesis protein CcmH